MKLCPTCKKGTLIKNKFWNEHGVFVFGYTKDNIESCSNEECMETFLVEKKNKRPTMSSTKSKPYRFNLKPSKKEKRLANIEIAIVALFGLYLTGLALKFL